ncbi:hypothetical protein D9619_011671 [Psilocybe cf. subviscida]|uniref:Uncharacterized protein n=1 Tax=Psilocybe cf. subviscida TaxID=2480587 RepID=A0A8H5BSS5_9AGAR|nr:hypothetical protein D9619_011671 [Psilocybe cf. subviscida]
MPSTRPGSGSKPSKSRLKPYGDTLRQQTPATSHHEIPPNDNCIQKRFPNFVPRNSLDIINLAGLAYEGPTDQASICAYLDIMQQSYVPYLMEKHNCTAEQAARAVSRDIDLTIGRMSATDTIGAKPRPGQKIWVRVMPSWPEYSIRLWASSADVQLFGMDFILSATGAPINLSHRFKLHTTAWIHGPGRMGDLEPFKMQLPPGTSRAYDRFLGPPGAGEELYMVGEEQTILIEDRLGPDPREVAQLNLGDDSDVKPLVTLLRFTIPKHPVHKGRKLHPGFKYDEVQWSIDE